MESATALLIDHTPAFEESESVAEDASPERRRRIRPGWAILTLLALAALGGLFYSRAWPPMATVMSASMNPTIKTGDVVVMKHLDRPIRVGDIIAVDVPDAARSRYGYPPEVVHRVVKIAPNGDITTKGDARPKPDPFTVKRGSIHARVIATIPAAGRVMAFFTSTLGLVWLAGGVLLLVILPIIERQRDMQAREEETLDVLRTELRSISDELAQLRMMPPAYDPYQVTVEMPPAQEMTEAVDVYMGHFEAEFYRALEDVTRELDHWDAASAWDSASARAASAGPHSSLERNRLSE